MFTKASISWNMNQIVKMMKNGKITFDNAVQRGLTWTTDQKSLLIHSILTGYPIPALYTRRVVIDGNKVYDMLDGKQRAHAIYEFIENEFELKNIPEVELESGESIDINGMKFSDLNDELRDRVIVASFSINYFDDMTDDEVAEMFYRLNNGKPLSAIVMTRCKAKSLDKIRELGQHQLFKSTLTAKAMERYTNEDIVIKSWMMLHTPLDEICLDTKVVRPVMQNVELTDDDVKELNHVFDRILAAFNAIESRKIAKKLVTRTHMISAIPFVKKSIDDGMRTDQFAEWFEDFFGGNSTEYNEYIANASQGANHHGQVVARYNAMESSYENYFNDFDDAFTSDTYDDTETAKQISVMESDDYDEDDFDWDNMTPQEKTHARLLMALA